MTDKSMEPPSTSVSRRRFITGAAALAGTAGLAGALPESSARAASAERQGVDPAQATAGPAPFPQDKLPGFLQVRPPLKPNVEVERRSILVPTYDGTKIAVDVLLPKGLAPGAKIPAIYSMTRYWRSQKDGPVLPLDQRWISQGYARVLADARGTGASFGQWYAPWTPQEVQDIGFIANWIAKQPWSNGNVATTGLSYPGSTSQVSPAFGAPAIKAIAPRSIVFDAYTELLAPGGVIAENLWTTWGKLSRRLDLDQSPSSAPPGPNNPFSNGVRPVDGPDGDARLTAAIEEHKLNPWSFDQEAYQMTFKDQPLTQFGGWPFDASSPTTFSAQIQRSNAPIYTQVSWVDAGTAQGAVNRFMSWNNPQLVIIGAWDHETSGNFDQFTISDKTLNFPTVDQQSLWFWFMNEYINKKNSATPPRKIIYYTMAENVWKTTDVWPLPGARKQRFYFDAGQTLSSKRPNTRGNDSYDVDFTATVGPNNRWSTEVGPAPDYGDRADADRKLLTYTSTPLTDDVEVTGEAVVSLTVKSNQQDGHFFVYLEDVAPDGKVTYVTEGQLRALHRKLSNDPAPYKTTYPYRSFAMKDAELLKPGEVADLTFPLLATSVLFKAGHRIRIAVAGADDGNFMRIPHAAQGSVTLGVERGGTRGSFVDLPVVPHR